MKAKIMLIVAVSVLFILGGCGSQETSSAPQETGQNQAAENPAKMVTEIPIGDPVEIEGMEIQPIYFEASELHPAEKAGLNFSEADVHIEADIKAIEGNKVGFGIGEWIPYLTVHYEVTYLENGNKVSGTLMPMNAQDGPHYGANIKMPDAGKYKLSLSIESPEKQNYLLHVDQGTGVEGKFWTEPIKAEWEFAYMPKK